MDRAPSWQSTIVGLAFIGLVGAIFLVVYDASGIDAALKAWAGLGTVVGVVVGAIPTYFFGRGAVASVKDQADAASKQLTDEQTKRKEADLRTQLVLGFAHPEALQQAVQAAPDLFST